MMKILILIIVAHISGVALSSVYKVEFPKVYEIVSKLLRPIGEKLFPRTFGK